MVRSGLGACAVEALAAERGVARELGFDPVHGARMVAARISDRNAGGAGDSAAAGLPVRDGVSRIHAAGRRPRGVSTECEAIASNG